MGNYTVVVLDFETTGLSPDYGDRAIEIGAVLIRNNRIVDRFQSLMNPEMRISSFIENYTGITNKMLTNAPSIADVMRKFASFMEQHHLVAHNASFDRRFLDAELRRIDRQRRQEFACSMLVSRRVYPEAPGHNLEALVRYKRLTSGASSCLGRCRDDRASLDRNGQGSQNNYRLRHVPFDLMQRLSKVAKAVAPDLLKRVAVEQC